MSRNFSPSRSPGSARWQFGGASQRLRSSSFKKPPEPLRKAVADCLSSSSQHGNTSTIASEAGRTLRDYLAAPSTTDLAYCLIIEHTLSEAERSPAVVAKCVALLKRYLLRYVPSEQTLLQIDLFCANSISESGSSTSGRVSLGQQSGASIASSNTLPSSFLPASSIASEALVKSLNYVRSLVARHIPKRSFQPAAFPGASTSSSRQSLPTLSSLLSRSFNSQLRPGAVISRESPERIEGSGLSISDSSIVERVEGIEGTDYISIDALNWRWLGQQQSPLLSTESDSAMRPHDISTHSFLEVGAAALLVGDLEVKMRGQSWKYSDTSDIPHLDQLLQPSTVTTADFASAHSHLRVITASKRTKSGPHQIWEDSPVSTFRPRARQLFQYRPYSEQLPLQLNPAEVHEVISAFCSETSSLPKSNLMTVSSRLSNNSGKPSMDVAASVLIKLVIDMYVLDSRTAAPLTLSMLEEMLRSPRLESRVRAFDLILNLGIHAHLLEPMLADGPPSIEEECSQEPYLNNEGQLMTPVKRNTGSCKQSGIASAIDEFECWLLNILYEILLLLVQIEEKEETIWASALSCLLYFVCDRGKIRRNRLEGLDIRVIKVLLEISRENSWAELVHCKLVCMLTNMLYKVHDELVKVVSHTPIFLVEQVDLLGGINFICLEYSRANSREEKRNLFLVLLDYVLHQINEACVAAGDSEYMFDEIQPLATVLALADAPEAFYISVKHGVEGIGEIMRESISAALSRCPDSERLNMLLEKITRKLDTIISSFSRLDDEFSEMIRITKSYTALESIRDGTLQNGIGMDVRLSWTTLHSLLHSERSAYRQNGYIWLVELLLAEISEERGQSIWSCIEKFQRQIELAGSQDYSVGSEVPLPIWILCGLLKSKHNFIRWGFLFVLEKLLMRCKLLLDQSELEHSSSGKAVGYDRGNSRLEKANAMIDIMSSALSLVAQINETDRLNILKLCDMLFSQLCLRLVSATAMPLGDLACLGKVFGCTEERGKNDGNPCISQQEMNHSTSVFPGEMDSRTTSDHDFSFICKSASLAALLLRGQAIVPMQLVARVPTALLYWPLIQLAGAVADDIALGVAVGSKGRGNLPGATSDIRAALLLLLIGKCNSDAFALKEVGGEEFFRRLLDDSDSRVAFFSSAFLLKRMMTEEPEKYQRMLQSLIFRAQQSNNEKLLENPYLQIRGILQLSNDLGTGL